MEKGIRESNFELLRIVAMIMIIAFHILGHGKGLNSTDITSWNYVVAHLIKGVSIVGVNVYILISGYFTINSKFKMKKILKLYGQMYFYSVVISLVFWGFGLQKITFDGLLECFLPFTMQTWWFMSLYLVLYILSPFINKFLRALSIKEYKMLLIVLFFIFIVWPTLSLKLIPIDTSRGYSLYNFIYLYSIGAYINLYYKNKKYNKFVPLVVYLLSTVVLITFNIGVSRFLGRDWGLYYYNSFLVFVSCIAIFMFFKELKIKSNFINKLAALSLGVYLIHDHRYVREIIYEALNYSNYFNTKIFIAYTLFMVVIIFTGSLLLEYIRVLIFKNIHLLRYLLRKININFKHIPVDINDEA